MQDDSLNPTPAIAFDAAVDTWQAQQDTPWMRIKHVTTRANLQRHIVAEHPLRILDVGGGTGVESIPLAQQGHHIDLVDYSPAMLATARQAIAAANVQDRITLHHANLLDIPALFADACFDVVLCHNVIQYAGDPNAAMVAIIQPLKTNGICSIISQNRYAAPYRAALFDDDLDTAYESIDQRTEMTRVFGYEVPIYSGEEIIALLLSHGCTLLGHYGIWCMTMYWGDNARKADPVLYQKLERLELALSIRHPYNLLGRYYQIIGRKI